MLTRLFLPDLDASAPDWAKRFKVKLDQAFRQLRAVPNPILATVADLPAAGENIGVLVWVTALNRLAISDGTNWRRTDTGVIL